MNKAEHLGVIEAKTIGPVAPRALYCGLGIDQRSIQIKKDNATLVICQTLLLWVVESK